MFLSMACFAVTFSQVRPNSSKKAAWLRRHCGYPEARMQACFGLSEPENSQRGGTRETCADHSHKSLAPLDCG